VAAVSSMAELVLWDMGDVPFVNELETFVGNQFIAKHVAFFNDSPNTTFYSNPKLIPT